ncbi:MAG TPA: hypothetical protein DCG12_03005 [Planctomycetaceae bacterium]|nr:hypothetical protein [Planctomycetaceae bacterium]
MDYGLTEAGSSRVRLTRGFSSSEKDIQSSIEGTALSELRTALETILGERHIDTRILPGDSGQQTSGFTGPWRHTNS